MLIKDCDLSNETKKIVERVTHQNIGGEDIVIEGEVDCGDILLGAVTGNWACKNFLDRREEESGLCVKSLTFYYGKVGGLGYIVADDEFKEEEYNE